MQKIKLFLQKPNSNFVEIFSTSFSAVPNHELYIKGFDSDLEKYSVESKKLDSWQTFDEEIGELLLQENLVLDLDQDFYLKKVRKAIKTIKEDNDLQKVIVSRSKTVAFNPKNLEKLYRSLCESYPANYCYLLIKNQKEVWIGASPELLLKIKNKKVYTISLAGSKSSEKKDWKQKEYHEQEIVTQYITKTLEKYCKNIQTIGPKTVKSATVYHLKTEIEAEMIDEFLTFDLINDLNPTPAVCGLPKENAYQFIKANEGYNRELYTGFIGLKNMDEVELFVNLRCGQLFKNSIKLYVGGGITENSKPIDEWEETEIKSQTLINKIEQVS